MSPLEALFLAHTGVTLALAGLAWFVQVVHYPLLARVPAEGFAAYHREHTRLVAWVAGPLMVGELASGLGLALRTPFGVPVAGPWVGVGLIAVVWLSTALLQIPEHRRLGQGFDPAAHRRLLAGNWVRTAAWTARAGLVLGMLAAFRA